MYTTIEITKYDPQTILSKAEPVNDCLLWRGSLYQNGYGKYGKKMAHRISYEMLVGEIPLDMCLDHLCRNRECINPDHLEIVTPTENVMRGESTHARNARKTECIKGHKFTPENTYSPPKKNTRECRTCRSEAYRKYMELERGK